MSKTLYLNPDSNYVRKIVTGIINSNFHCPCRIEHTKETKCNFTSLPLPNKISSDMLCLAGQSEGGICHCGLYKEMM